VNNPIWIAGQKQAAKFLTDHSVALLAPDEEALASI
jgi:hypothetical protein